MPTSALYQMSRLTDTADAEQIHYDCIVIGGESDTRAYEVLRRAAEWKLGFDNVLMCDFIERRDAEDLTAREAYQSYSKLSLNIKPLECSLKDPSACLKSIPNTGLVFSSKSRVALDISSFTRPYCFALLKYLQDLCKLTTVDVYYTEPMSYVIPKGLVRSYRKSIGSLSVMEVPGFPGRDTGRTKKALVVTLGFDGDLSAFISDEVTPAFIVIVNGFPAYSPKFKDISLINNERLLNYSGVQENISYCRASNPFELFNLLVTLQERHPDTFFNIAPLGPKPMALGACMFALSDNSVRIVYPMPEKYTINTTDKCWHSWRYVIPLGSSLKNGAFARETSDGVE
jgi:hypothetical protein